MRDFLAYLQALVATAGRGVEDASDIMARLIRETGAAGEDANLLPHELLQNCIFILNAGHETTTNLICSGIWLLSQLPDKVAVLNADASLWPAPLRKSCAWKAPTSWATGGLLPVSRWGPALARGDADHAGYGAANRDPAVFDQPDEFRLDRGDNPHLAFAGGVHVCAGNTIARIEGQIALASLFRRWPDLQVGEGIRRSPRVRFRGFEEMPLYLGVAAKPR